MAPKTPGPNQLSLVPDTTPQPKPVDIDAMATEIARVASTPEHRLSVAAAYSRDAERLGLLDVEFPELTAEVGQAAVKATKPELPAFVREAAARYQAREIQREKDKLDIRISPNYPRRED